MADQNHLQQLHKGKDAWRNWRQTLPPLSRIDLTLADLRGADLSDFDLSSVDLDGADISCAQLTNVDLTGAGLEGANLGGSDLAYASLGAANGRRGNFENADFLGAECFQTSFEDANCVRAQFLGADLRETSFVNANLERANFSESSLLNTDLENALLMGAHIHVVHFHFANLVRANFERAYFADSVLAGIDLSETVGLENVEHGAPTSIGIDTLFLSGGRIPEPFLRGAGVPELLVSYSKSLVANPIEYSSCFISHSTIDQEIASKIRFDLRRRGVRCWLASEDLKIGDKFRSKIDESIRIHDKLLLILSANSIESSWVEDEVESALDRERNEGRSILFPVKIDDAVSTTNVAWARHLRQKRHIGDFRDWENSLQYSHTLERLLRDLNTEAPPI